MLNAIRACNFVPFRSPLLSNSMRRISSASLPSSPGSLSAELSEQPGSCSSHKGHAVRPHSSLRRQSGVAAQSGRTGGGGCETVVGLLAYGPRAEDSTLAWSEPARSRARAGRRRAREPGLSSGAVPQRRLTTSRAHAAARPRAARESAHGRRR
jgi:hypothetical protein